MNGLRRTSPVGHITTNMRAILATIGILIFLAMSPPVTAAIAIVSGQTIAGSCSTGSTSTCTITLPNNITSGDTFVYVANCGQLSGNGGFTSIADNKSDSVPTPQKQYLSTATLTAGLFSLAGFYHGITSGANVFTIVMSNCTFSASAWGWEISGDSGTQDTGASLGEDLGGNSGSPSPISTTYTAATSGEFMVGAFAPSGGTISSITSWTIDYNNGSTSLAGGHLLSPSSGSNTLSIAYTAGSNQSVTLATVAIEPSGGSFTHTGWQMTSGSFALPTGSNSGFWGCTGASVTPNGSSISYWQPSGACGTN
jgi:hypothetical protein